MSSRLKICFSVFVVFHRYCIFSRSSKNSASLGNKIICIQNIYTFSREWRMSQKQNLMTKASSKKKKMNKQNMKMWDTAIFLSVCVCFPLVVRSHKPKSVPQLFTNFNKCLKRTTLFTSVYKYMVFFNFTNF